MLSSCSGSKFLFEDEIILDKQSISGVGAKMRNHLPTLYEQESNSHFLLSHGPVHLVYVYEIGKKRFDTAKLVSEKQAIISKYDTKIGNTKRSRKKKRLLEKQQKKANKVTKKLKEGNLLMRWGEPLSVVNESGILLTKDKISQYLNSKGYYANKIGIQKKYKKDSSRVEIKYTIKRGREYFIDSIQLEIPDPIVRELFMKNIEDSKLKKERIQQQNLTDERDRVYQMMVNNGYFTFFKDLVHFKIDSVSLGPQKILVREIINNPPNKEGHEIFEIDSVIFVTDTGLDINKQYEDESFKDITYTFGRFKYSTKILDWHTYLYANRLYRRDEVLETQRQLSYLDNFKFININFDTLGGKFTAHIFTSPADKYQISSEIGLSKTQGLPGPFANLTIQNRNLFRGLEIVELNNNFKVVGLEGVSNQATTYSSLQSGTELSITFPQFLSPLGRFYKKKIAKFNPRTRFGLAFGHEERLNEYKRTTFNTNMAYIWKENDYLSYTLKPMDVSYINSKTDSTFQTFLDTLALTGNTYANAFNSAFVSKASFQVTANNNYGDSPNSSYLQLYVEAGGNFFSLFGKTPFGNSLAYYKYVKSSVDFRKNFYLNRETSLATRFNIGVSVPYGENNSLPYLNYFFGGGSNSMRAWKPRRLGPGAYGKINTDSTGAKTVDYQREQPGDMTIEMSVEVRQHLFGFVDWAFFIDAGNIWLLRSKTIDPSLDPEGDNGIFKFNTFAKEIAVGAGLGLRFDLTFLIFRVDFGWKFLDPAQPLGKRWVGNTLFPNPLKKSEINIGIGYPF